MPEEKSIQTPSSSSEEDKTMAVLSYLGILVLVPLLLKKDSEFNKFHIQQGLVLLVVWIVWSIVWWIFAWIPFIGWLIGLAGWLVLVYLMIVGILNALNGKKKELPIIGQWGKSFRI